MSYLHTLEDTFPEVRLRDFQDAPHYASVDSAPAGFAVARSKWVAPIFLSTFTVVCAVAILAEPNLSQAYVTLLERLTIIDTSLNRSSLGVRPLFFSFVLTLWLFVKGTWEKKGRIFLLTATACTAAVVLTDVILLYLMQTRGGGPFTLVGNILTGYALFTSCIFVIMWSMRMPQGVRTPTIYRRSRYYILVSSTSIVVAGIITILLVQKAEAELKYLRDLAILGGVGPSMMMFSNVLWPLMAAIAFLILKKRKIKSTKNPNYPIGIVVPAYNEAHGITDCINSLDTAAANYRGSCWLYLIDNGSIDSTVEIAKQALSRCRALKGQVLLCPQRGKAAALNFGVKQAVEDIIVRVDADTEVSPDLFVKVAPYFSDPLVGVAGGIPLPQQPDRLLSKARAIEVYYNIGYARFAHSTLDAVLCVPGIQTAYRRQALVEAGDFSEGMNGEDTDMTVRIGRLGYHVVVDPSIKVYSEVPSTWDHLREQRIRWSRSVLHVFARNKSAFLMRQGIRGLYLLPNSIWGQFRRAFLIMFLIYGSLVIVINPSVLNIGGGAALGAMLFGPSAVVTAITICFYRRFDLVPYLPAYIVFRVMRAYLSIEMLFTLSPKTKSR
jgi:cellulose synthase/poly-beta-1,6-N-acetylglucosamine synthase-like glycosyltransferase